jgi:hypothetical protein
MIPAWFQEAIDHPNERRGVDILFDKIADWFFYEDYASVDKFLAELERPDFSPIPNTLMVGVLTITLPAAHLLPSRPSVFDWVYVELLRRGRPAERIMAGLKDSDPIATKAHNQIFSDLLGRPPIPTEE